MSEAIMQTEGVPEIGRPRMLLKKSLHPDERAVEWGERGCGFDDEISNTKLNVVTCAGITVKICSLV
jgi:hypothetical protein